MRHSLENRWTESRNAFNGTSSILFIQKRNIKVISQQREFSFVLFTLAERMRDSILFFSVCTLHWTRHDIRTYDGIECVRYLCSGLAALDLIMLFNISRFRLVSHFNYIYTHIEKEWDTHAVGVQMNLSRFI